MDGATTGTASSAEPGAIGTGQITQARLTGIDPLFAAHLAQGHDDISLIRQQIGKAFVGIACPEIEPGKLAVILTREQ